MGKIEEEYQNENADIKLHEKMNNQFQKERDKWKSILNDYSIRYGDLSDLVDLQMNIISDMGYISDYKTSIAYKISYRMVKIKKLKGDAIKIHINGNSRYTAKERDILLEDDVKYLEFIVDIYDGQLSFYSEIYNQLNSILYNIKTRIELEQHRTPKL